MNTTTARHVGSNVVAFAFAIGQRVRIDAIDTPGTVQGLMVNADGLEYFVAYFDDDKRRHKEWLSAAELSRL